MSIHEIILQIDDVLWGYLTIPILLVLGLMITSKLKFPQIQRILNFKKNSIKVSTNTNLTQKNRGIPPITAFFTSIGGCIGMANLVSICTAVKIGGPGAVFWMWVAAFLGMVLKYSEVYLGIKFRNLSSDNKYFGGPMLYLQKAFNNKFLAIVFCILLAFYGTEIYLFRLIVETININWNINYYLVLVLLLISVMLAVKGGIERVGKISSLIIPIFFIIYISMGLWIFYKNIHNFIPSLKLIFKSAFTGHGVIGGFAGASILTTVAQGMARGCYSGDIGIGYSSIIHAESSNIDPKKEANLAFLEIYLDTFVICTITTLIIIITGVWKEPIPEHNMTQIALTRYFPYMKFFMPLFLFISGYSTVTAFFVVGLKCAKFLSPKYGKTLYYIYGISAFIVFSFIQINIVFNLMSICGGLLLIINCIGIYKLKNELK